MKKRVLTALVGIPVLILGVFFAPIWLFGVIIAVICGFVAFELMRCAIGQAPKRLYISSILSAVAIANRILKEGAPAVADYKKFLSGGCSTDPISLLKIAGVDMSSPEPVNSALALFGELVDEMEQLV